MNSLKESNLERVMELLDGEVKDNGHTPRDSGLHGWILSNCYSWMSVLKESGANIASYTCGLFENGFVVGALYTHLFGLPDNLIDVANRELSDTQKGK